MRKLNCNILSAADDVSTDGGKIDANQLIAASFQAYFGDSHAAGTLKIQASNDINNDQYQPNTLTPTNWTDIANATASVTAGSSVLISLNNMCYRWLRAVYTNTANYIEKITVTVPATASATQGDYFVLFAPNGNSVAFWLDIDADGTAPTGAAYVAATTKVKISIITAGTNTANGGILAAAGVKQGYTPVDNGDGTVTYTQALSGACTAPQRHNSGDSGNGSFTLAITNAGAAVTTINCDMFALSL